MTKRMTKLFAVIEEEGMYSGYSFQIDSIYETLEEAIACLRNIADEPTCTEAYIEEMYPRGPNDKRIIYALLDGKIVKYYTLRGYLPYLYTSDDGGICNSKNPYCEQIKTLDDYKRKRSSCTNCILRHCIVDTDTYKMWWDEPVMIN